MSSAHRHWWSQVALGILNFSSHDFTQLKIYPVYGEKSLIHEVIPAGLYEVGPIFRSLIASGRSPPGCVLEAVLKTLLEPRDPGSR
jgi:hypothetical protein